MKIVLKKQDKEMDFGMEEGRGKSCHC